MCYGMMSYIVLKGHWCDSAFPHAHAPVKDAVLTQMTPFVAIKVDSHIAFRAHAVPLRVYNVSCPFDLHSAAVSDSHLPCPCRALTMPFFSRPRHSTAVQRRPVGYLAAFGFFRLPHGVPRRLLSEAYQSSSQRSIPTTVNSGSSALRKRRCVKLLD